MRTKNIIFMIIIVFALQGLVIALIPPPPVDQRIGVYDSNFANFTEYKCRGCHTAGVPDDHHGLVPIGEYQCTNCHPVLPNGSGITMVRNCMQCHDNTFNGLVIPRPHHETKDAQDRHCSRCHGNLVNDYDDNHIIRDGPPSSMTPDTKYRAINTTSGRKWGGCEACHEQNTTLEPPISFNNKTHHRLGSLSGFNPQNSSKCAVCHGNHSSPYGSDYIRYCEQCHGFESLHSIQYDFTNTSGQKGYGHIGDGNFDCNGCHASYIAGEVAPGASVITPVINNLSTSKVYAEAVTVLTINGTNFVTTVDGVMHTSVVIVTDGINSTTLTPDSITPSQMVVTMPALIQEELYGVYALKNGSVKSNKLPLVSTPMVKVSFANKIGTTITINGSGFGLSYDPLYSDWYNVTIKNGDISRNISITNWSETMVVVTSTDAASGDIATVNSINGANSTTVTDG